MACAKQLTVEVRDVVLFVIVHAVQLLNFAGEVV